MNTRLVWEKKMNRIEVINEDADPLPYGERNIYDFTNLCIKEVLKRLNLFLPLDFELSIIFVSRDKIKKLNTQYRNKNYETDVLSFPMFSNLKEIQDSNEDPILLGDIVLSAYNIKENSIEFKVSFKEEICRVIIHSILHLFCMDHKGVTIEEPMIRMQEEILSAMIQKEGSGEFF